MLPSMISLYVCNLILGTHICVLKIQKDRISSWYVGPAFFKPKGMQT
uniref:Uncharacterized protein n=1 Tax=Arundo donax TaxID=35708 RepID=A0A0A9ABS6_ARUDO